MKSNVAVAALLAASLALSACSMLPGLPTRAKAPAPEPDVTVMAKGPCETVKAAVFTDPSVAIASTVDKPAGTVEGFRAPGAAPPAPLPAHCEVFGELQRRQGANGQSYAIKFHMRLPTEWNGRFFFQGGGGTNGSVGDALGNLLANQPGNALSRGYAVISQDSGHDNTVNNDPARQGVVTFGWDDEARRNYGGASIGPVTEVGRSLIHALYGRDPRFTYYVGGSKGGQEAMMAAQRFPALFDAVLVGYPGFRLADAGAVGQMWDAQAFAEAAKALGQAMFDGTPLINKAVTDDDLLLVSGAVLSACDGLDNTVDGMVENFAACTTAQVAPALAAITCKGEKTLTCLAPAQVAAFRKVFDGAKARDGRQLYANWPWDAGIAAKTRTGASQGWRMWKTGPYNSPVNSGLAVRLGGASASAVFTSPPTQVADESAALTRYALGVDVEANAAKAREKWGRFNESSVDFMHADATDLSAFTKRGGKLLIFHGVSDPVFSVNDTIAWWTAVNTQAGGTAASFARLYAVPGMNHGGGGPATDQFAVFDALVAWRERGVAPEAIVATAGAGAPWPGRTRLLCPYPQQPRRTGADIEHAESFGCYPAPAPAAP